MERPENRTSIQIYSRFGERWFLVLATGFDFSCESLLEAYKKEGFFSSHTLDDSIAHTATAKKKLLF